MPTSADPLPAIKVWRVEHEGCPSVVSEYGTGGNYHGPQAGRTERYCPANDERPQFGAYGSCPRVIADHERCAVLPDWFAYWWNEYEIYPEDFQKQWEKHGWVVGEYETKDYRIEVSNQVVFNWNTAVRLRTIPWAEVPVKYWDDTMEDD